MDAFDRMFDKYDKEIERLEAESAELKKEIDILRIQIIDVAQLENQRDRAVELLKKVIEEDVNCGFLTPELYNLISQFLEEI